MAKLLAMISLQMLPKSQCTDLAYHLHHDEFKCQCAYENCTYTLVHPKLLEAWQFVRYKMDTPLKVNSGFRCQKHNASKEVGGRSHSRHQYGMAVDISLKRLNKGEIEDLKYLANKAFDVVIEYPTFIHCHVEPDA